ncbi:MAG: hypothetical protein AAB448_01655 [Patescibacteria group bacterium]
MIHPLRSKSRRIGPAVLICVLLLGGGSAFWFGLQAFRTHADEQSQEDASDTVLEDALDTSLQNLPSIASLISSSGAGDIGRATRVIHEHVATIDVLVALPAADTSVYEYHVWLVKDGLADVVDIGVLTARADGTWAGVFTAGPATGVVDPALFSEVVIMLEPRDGNDAPSGMKVGEGKW